MAVRAEPPEIIRGVNLRQKGVRPEAADRLKMAALRVPIVATPVTSLDGSFPGKDASRMPPDLGMGRVALSGAADPLPLQFDASGTPPVRITIRSTHHRVGPALPTQGEWSAFATDVRALEDVVEFPRAGS